MDESIPYLALDHRTYCIPVFAGMAEVTQKVYPMGKGWDGGEGLDYRLPSRVRPRWIPASAGITEAAPTAGLPS